VPARIQVRDESNVIAYNAIAKRIMDEHHIPINDLHARVLSWGQKGADWQLPVNEHFRAEGYTDMATEVARYILAGSVAEMKSGPR
jgi:lysophospholipase L1-like esterase